MLQTGPMGMPDPNQPPYPGMPGAPGGYPPQPAGVRTSIFLEHLFNIHVVDAISNSFFVFSFIFMLLILSL